MNLMLFSKNIYWRSVIVAAILAWLFGGAWYHPDVFGAAWAESPIVRSPEETGLIVFIIVTVAISLIPAYVINGIAGFMGLHGFREGFVLSLWIGVGLLIVNMVGGLMFMKVSPEMMAIDAGYVYCKMIIYCLFATMWYKKPSKQK